MAVLLTSNVAVVTKVSINESNLAFLKLTPKQWDTLLRIVPTMKAEEDVLAASMVSNENRFLI